MPLSISARTIAGCSSRASQSPATRPGRFASSTASAGSFELGEGVSGSGRLSEAAMSRTIAALKICREKMQARHVTRSQAHRHGGVPRRDEQRGVPRAGRRGHGASSRNRRSRDRGVFGDGRMFGARRPGGRRDRVVRYRRRLVGNRLARASGVCGVPRRIGARTERCATGCGLGGSMKVGVGQLGRDLRRPDRHPGDLRSHGRSRGRGTHAVRAAGHGRAA